MRRGYSHQNPFHATIAPDEWMIYSSCVPLPSIHGMKRHLRSFSPQFVVDWAVVNHHIVFQTRHPHPPHFFYWAFISPSKRAQNRRLCGIYSPVIIRDAGVWIFLFCCLCRRLTWSCHGVIPRPFLDSITLLSTGTGASRAEVPNDNMTTNRPVIRAPLVEMIHASVSRSLDRRIIMRLRVSKGRIYTLLGAQIQNSLFRFRLVLLFRVRRVQWATF